VPDLLSDGGVRVETTHLRAGDYDVGRGSLVERKTVRHLHASVVDGSLWPQLGRLRQAARCPYLLVEGADLDDGPLSASSIRGACIAAGDLGIVLLQSRCRNDSALWLRRLAERRQSGEPARRPYAGRPRADTSSAAEIEQVVLAGEEEWRRVPGVGNRRASAPATTFRAPQAASHSRLSRE
jgi:Fanconi anemia group M protein